MKKFTIDKFINKATFVDATIHGDGLTYPRTPNVYPGDLSGGYEKGDILDANAVATKIQELSDTTDLNLNELLGLLNEETLNRIQGDLDNKDYTDLAIKDLINTSPDTLDTLKEIAEALGNDPDFAANVYNRINELQEDLDTEIQDRKDAIANLKNTTDQDLSDLLNDLQQEVIDRTTGDDALTTNLNKEISDRVVADDELQSNLNEETTAREDADSNLLTLLDEEISNRTTADADLLSQINTEKTYRESADTALQTALNLEISNRTNADTDLLNQITKEVADRQSAITTEKTAREDADDALQAALTQEIADRKAGDTTEATARQNADTTLQANIDDEETARIAGDNALAANLNKEISDRTAADTAEASARQTADQSLQDQIDALNTDITADLEAEIVARKAGDEALTSNLNKEISDRTTAVTNEATARKNADDALLAAIGAEETARIAADNTLTTNLNKEISDRLSAITTEQNARTVADQNLQNQIDLINTDAKTYSISAVAEAELETNVREAYKLVDEDGTQVGSTIKIYKDTSLQNVELVDQALVFTYLLEDGTTKDVSVDVSKFLAESEFSDGLQVVNHVVSVKKDTSSENFLSVGTNGIKLSGILDAIDSAINDTTDDYTSKITELDTNLKKEIIDRGAADTTLLSNIDLEIADRQSGDDSLNTKITTETTARTNADANLQEQINTLDNSKLNVLTAGTGISISNNTISGKPVSTTEAGLMSSEDYKNLNTYLNFRDADETLLIGTNVENWTPNGAFYQDDESGNTIHIGINGLKFNSSTSEWEETNSPVDMYISSATSTHAGAMSAADKTKLDGIEEGGQVNIIEGVSLNGTTLTPSSSKVVDIPLVSSDTAGVLPSTQPRGTANRTFIPTFTDSSTGVIWNAPGIKLYGEISGGAALGLVFTEDNNTIGNAVSSTTPLNHTYVNLRSDDDTVKLSYEDEGRTLNFRIPFNVASPNNLLTFSSNGFEVSKPTIQELIDTSVGEIEIPTYTAGDGIDITDNVISCTLDTSLYKVVTTLPSTGEENKIYLKEADTQSEGNVYTEYAWVNNAWEEIGSYKAEVDLSNYVTKDTVATTSTAGLLSAADKVKLDNLSDLTAGNGISISNGTISIDSSLYRWLDNYYVNNLSIATNDADSLIYTLGYRNLVTGDLLSTINGPEIPVATTTTAGIMTAADKINLDNLVTWKNTITLNDTSTTSVLTTFKTDVNNISMLSMDAMDLESGKVTENYLQITGSETIDITESDNGVLMNAKISTKSGNKLTIDTENGGLLVEGELSDYYGIRWTNENTTPVRIGNVTWHRTLPIQSKMKRCMVQDDGTVKYLKNWKYYEDDTEAKYDGTDGQCMVEIPEYWYKTLKVEDEDGVLTYELRLYPYETAGANHSKKFYTSAFEATSDDADSTATTKKLYSISTIDFDWETWDPSAIPAGSTSSGFGITNLNYLESATKYRGGNRNTTSCPDDSTISLLGRPATSLTRSAFRTRAANRGAGWSQQHWFGYQSIVRLYIVEYCNFNTQANYIESKTAEGYAQGGLGAGVTTLGFALWNDYNGDNPFIPCGITIMLGNQTGIVKTASYNYTNSNNITISMPSIQVPSYRGIENPFGHIWKWCDGINVYGTSSNDQFYTCTDITKFTDSSVSYSETATIPDGYIYDGNSSVVGSGYIKTITFADSESSDFIPKETGGTASSYYYDYVWLNNNGQKVVRLGGRSDIGSRCGLFCFAADHGASYVYAFVGGRLNYTPSN